jgi:hypothetical protein
MSGCTRLPASPSSTLPDHCPWLILASAIYLGCEISWRTDEPTLGRTLKESEPRRALVGVAATLVPPRWARYLAPSPHMRGTSAMALASRPLRGQVRVVTAARGELLGIWFGTVILPFDKVTGFFVVAIGCEAMKQKT